MARQATATGDHVPVVILLDTFPPAVSTPVAASRVRRFRAENFAYVMLVVRHRFEVRHDSASKVSQRSSGGLVDSATVD